MHVLGKTLALIGISATFVVNAADANVPHVVAKMRTWIQMGILMLMRLLLQWSKQNRQVNLVGWRVRLREWRRAGNQYLFSASRDLD
ncbi:hypothetical protein PEX2_034970 [Penicillium expansum]|uniref:Uncharacterized protein n=1 Tax=Penicillium expansum TaxID=27334 RepID=A0A0A2JY09_PENEN|nr:hypothetical protein PEX2_034970 [Penicillium expansum]KGO44788.1 hypothetical protein PEXP_021640 [Penicillium expansum]KGO60319.1 hypothetical protein PEX2_034970 [Penicillium expansum]